MSDNRGGGRDDAEMEIRLLRRDMKVLTRALEEHVEGDKDKINCPSCRSRKWNCEMNDDRGFWIATVGAVLVKLVLSPTADWRVCFWRALLRGVMTGLPAVYAAYVFTDPVLNWLEWNPDQYRNAMAAVLALAGENLIRKVLSITSSDTMLADLIKMWRGQGGKKE